MVNQAGRCKCFKSCTRRRGVQETLWFGEDVWFPTCFWKWYSENRRWMMFEDSWSNILYIYIHIIYVYTSLIFTYIYIYSFCLPCKIGKHCNFSNLTGAHFFQNDGGGKSPTKFKVEGCWWFRTPAFKNIDCFLCPVVLQQGIDISWYWVTNLRQHPPFHLLPRFFFWKIWISMSRISNAISWTHIEIIWNPWNLIYIYIHRKVPMYMISWQIGFPHIVSHHVFLAWLPHPCPQRRRLDRFLPGWWISMIWIYLVPSNSGKWRFRLGFPILKNI